MIERAMEFDVVEGNVVLREMGEQAVDLLIEKREERFGIDFLVSSAKVAKQSWVGAGVEAVASGKCGTVSHGGLIARMATAGDVEGVEIGGDVFAEFR